MDFIYEYSPYGRVVQSFRANTHKDRYLSTGHEREEATNYDYRLARLYDAELGRFLSVDPLADHPRQIGNSTYSAMWNNPIRYNDPDGRCPSCGDDYSNLLAVEFFNLKHSLYNLVARPLGYEAKFVLNDRGNYETGFVKNADDFAGGALKFGVDALTVATFGRGGGATGGLLAKTGASAPLIDAAKEGVKRYTAVDAGPLPEAVAKTFRGASYSENVAKEPVKLYRSYGGDAKEMGSYWSRTKPTGPLQSKIDNSLLPSWGNTAEKTTSITIPKGTKFFEGASAPQGGIVGGGNQIYIPRENLNPNWLNNK